MINHCSSCDEKIVLSCVASALGVKMRLVEVNLFVWALFMTPCAISAQTLCDFESVGTNSGVICLTKSSFVFGFQDPTRDRPIYCPDGQVCADVRQICATAVTPVCKNSKPRDPAACNDCIDNQIGSPVCINKNQYSVCSNGALQRNLVFTCPQETPYCKVKVDVSGGTSVYTSVCGYDSTQFDCPDGSTGVKYLVYGKDTGIYDANTRGFEQGYSASISRTQSFQCQAEGFFADPRSTDCISYFKCQRNGLGELETLSFSCAAAGAAFNPATQRCETSFKCNE